MKKVTCVASDLDGTIVYDDHVVSEATLHMIQKLQERGILFLPCTGRGYVDFKDAFPSSLKMPSILLNGALYANEEGHTILSYPMDKHDSMKMENIFLDHDMPCVYFCENKLYGSGDVSLLSQCAKKFLDTDTYFVDTIISVSSLEDIHEPILKMETMHTNTTLIKNLYNEIHRQAHLQVASSMSFNIEVTAKGVNKATMLQEVLRYHQLQKEHLYCFGDSDNDKEMFIQFPNAIAVANAKKSILDLASDVCESCEKDGVAKYLMNLLEQAY